MDCCYHVTTSSLLRDCHTVNAYIHYIWSHLRANVIHFTDNYCWFTLVQVLAHVTPHAVYSIMLESHLLQHNHCNSPVVAKYTPMNMVWVTNMHCIRFCMRSTIIITMATSSYVSHAEQVIITSTNVLQGHNTVVLVCCISE